MGAETTPAVPLQLEALALALTQSGLCVEARLFRDSYLLKVWHPDLPVTGLSVVEDLHAEVPWFRDSGGNWLAPCLDVPGAVEVIAIGLERCLKAVRAGGSFDVG